MARVLFAQVMAYEHIGTMYLASVLKHHDHQCDVLVGNLENNLLGEVKAYRPDLMCFSVITGSQQWCLDTAEKIKAALNCKVVFGGPHATYFPEVIRYEQVDYVCRGEGEYALLELADAIDQNKDTSGIKNIWCKNGNEVIRNEVRELIGDLDALPFPDRSVYYKYPVMRRMPQKRFMATRGCPYNCSFCFNHALRQIYEKKGKYIRTRSVENVISEIIKLKNEYPLKTVYFDDDTYILDHDWQFSFFREYRKRVGLPFICLVRANLVTEELINEFRQSGCRTVFFGIEAGNERLRNEILKKNLSDKDIINTARILHKHRIRFKTYNMLGLPDETVENAFETLEMNIKIKTDYPSCSVFQPYPGTELGEYSKKKGYVGKGFSCDDIQPFFYRRSMLTKKSDINQIVNLQKFFVAGVKFPFLVPFIKRLIKFPPNFIFDLFFIFGYAYNYLGSEHINILNSFGEGMRIIKRSFSKK